MGCRWRYPGEDPAHLLPSTGHGILYLFSSPKLRVPTVRSTDTRDMDIVNKVRRYVLRTFGVPTSNPHPFSTPSINSTISRNPAAASKHDERETQGAARGKVQRVHYDAYFAMLCPALLFSIYWAFFALHFVSCFRIKVL